ncbi:MAG: DNA helicase RecQ [Desulfurivibrio sp.]|nr:DNA helicase RecQ [Desulfurivibrio sp.]
MSTIDQTLQAVFGYDTFRPKQREIIERLLAGEDAFVLMPTGGGKSLCYQIPALHRPGVGIVVSPLISLMKDQVDALKTHGIKAACYNSALEAAEARKVLAQMHAGQLDLLYVAPERVLSNDFLSRLKELSIALFAIDEAHCISQWGHDFRPEYTRLNALRQHFPQVPLIALTATAEPHTRGDILERLQMAPGDAFITSFDRPNIRYTVLTKKKPLAQLRDFVNSRPGEAGIVYCLSRKRVEEVTAQLNAAGLAARSYHAGLAATERGAAQEAFLRDDITIIVATVAFGMGIDKSNIRFVVHYDIPKNIEGYYQETGRAGRDGLPAEALLLFGMGDVAVARGLIDNSENEERRRIETHKLQAMVGFAQAGGCRRRILLNYFGEEPTADCGNCDICLDPPKRREVTEDARKALSCVYRVGQRFGISHVVAVLRGSRNQRVRQLGHDQLSTYGIGADRDQDYWSALLRHLIHQGYLEQDIGNYAVLKIKESSRPLLRGELKVEMALPRTTPAATGQPTTTAGGGKQRAGDRNAELDEAARELFERLRRLRKEIADHDGVPPFVVFSDASLRAMATTRPADSEALLAIPGVGHHKLERYGPQFLTAIAARD